MQPIHVAAGIIWRQGRFLAALRPQGKPRAEYWEFPGGKQEPGEDIQQCLRRELLEELDITCLSVDPWQRLEHHYPDLRVILHFMHVRAFSGTPRPQDGQELRWVTPEQALLLPFLPADRDILEQLRTPG